MKTAKEELNKVFRRITFQPILLNSPTIDASDSEYQFLNLAPWSNIPAFSQFACSMLNVNGIYFIIQTISKGMVRSVRKQVFLGNFF